MFPELDKFLCGDLAVALANIRHYLNCDARDEEGMLSPEKVDQIVSYLDALENRAMELADSLSLHARPVDGRAGVISALRCLQRSDAA